ncbi:hypothetical protein X798_02552 [Onchocerca flexuosa]|uniref:Uncharacterized protein n=1 Tax=Onchocerca flexuosa TaxID=387005 RepID=A0A238C0Q2_9BILA|nr:hypothetical protein X798_02552 [Onchocerca flexuosa]
MISIFLFPKLNSSLFKLVSTDIDNNEDDTTGYCGTNAQEKSARHRTINPPSVIHPLIRLSKDSAPHLSTFIQPNQTKVMPTFGNTPHVMMVRYWYGISLSFQHSNELSSHLGKRDQKLQDIALITYSMRFSKDIEKKKGKGGKEKAIFKNF